MNPSFPRNPRVEPGEEPRATALDMALGLRFRDGQEIEKNTWKSAVASFETPASRAPQDDVLS
jgi:hypothetical protein